MLTTVGINDPKTVKKWATSLAIDVNNKSYFGPRFMGEGENSIIEKKTELEDTAGDRVSFDLSMRLRGGAVYGDDLVEGTEENLTFLTDEVIIDQIRKGTSAGGRMTQKRMVHDLRKIARTRLTTWFAEWMDDLIFAYLSGDDNLSAINQDNKFSRAFAGNAITPPDAQHIMYGGAATSKATITTADKMTVNLIERTSVKPEMMNSVNPDVVQMTPVSIEGGDRFILLMNPWQAFDLRTETGEGGWVRLSQALMTSEGRASPICKGGLGMINNTILHSHPRVRRWNNYGAGANLPGSRALLLGRQAGVVAWGGSGMNTRMNWVEKKHDAENQLAIYAGQMFGFKKTTFNGMDFGVHAIDTYSKDPNA